MSTNKLGALCKTPESTVYRQVADELVLIQLDTGNIFYFNPDTQRFLEYFKEPRDLQSFISGAGLQEKPEERQYLEGFCDFLLESQILKPVGDAEFKECSENIEYTKPLFLRKGERTLDEITFLSP